MITLIAVLALSCEKEKERPPSILGYWVLNIGADNDIPVQMSFFSNNFFEWIPLMPAEGYTRRTAKYSINNGVLKISNDPDCPEDGEYNLTVQGTTLTLTARNEDCLPRKGMLEGSWNRKNMMIDVRVQGIWSKSMTVSDTARNVLFSVQQNGIFEWLISKETNLYQSSIGRYNVGPDYLIVYNFLDCSSIIGYYSYQLIDEKQLIVNEAQDYCTIRIPAIEGTWSQEVNY